MGAKIYFKKVSISKFTDGKKKEKSKGTVEQCTI
jgi:hypothetical protein